MTRDELIFDLRTDLGEPTVKCELDDVSFDRIIEKGLRWFRGKKGLITAVPIAVSPGTREYDFPVDAYEIVDVVLPLKSDLTDLSSLDFFDIIPGNTFQGGGSAGYSGSLRFDSGGYVSVMQALETRRRIFGADPDWYIVDKKIFVQPKNASGMMIVFYKKKTIDVPDFYGRDEELFYRYCLAKSKAILGTIRSKYSSYPAAGGMITTDGEALKAEAREEMIKLDEEIADSQGNAGGIVVG